METTTIKKRGNPNLWKHGFTKENQPEKVGRKKGIEKLIREAINPDELKEIIKNVAKEAKGGNIKAAEFLFDRLYGKPTVMVDLLDSKGSTLIQNNFNIEVSGKSPDELKQLYLELSESNEEEPEILE